MIATVASRRKTASLASIALVAALAGGGARAAPQDVATSSRPTSIPSARTNGAEPFATVVGGSVIVVDEDGRPVEGAGVRVMRAGTPAYVESAPLATATTDGEGRAQLPAAPFGLSVSAQLGDANGGVVVSLKDRYLGVHRRITLSQPVLIDVEVQDALGRPLRGVETKAFVGKASMGPRPPARASTDGEGRATLSLSRAVYGAARDIHVAAAVPCRTLTGAVTWHGRRGRVALRLPDPDVVELTLRVAGAGDDDVMRRFGWSMKCDGAFSFNEIRLRAGACRFGGFARGSRVAVFAVDGERWETTREIVVPDDGDVAEVVLPTGPALAWIDIPYLLPDAPPPCETFVEVVQAGAVPSTDRAFLPGRKRALDPAGVVSVPVAPDAPGFLNVWAMTRSDTVMEAALADAGKFDFPALSPGELRRLPPIPVAMPPPWVRGRVLDASGAPAAGALATCDVGTSATGNLELSPPWTLADRDGAFSLRAPRAARGRAVHLVVIGAHGVAEVPAEGGDHHELRLRPFARLNGAVRAPTDAGPSRVAVSARLRRSGHPPESAAEPVRIELPRGGGPFEFPKLAAGTYDLEFFFDGELAHRVEDVAVASGATTADPRLADVDLTPHLTEAVVVVVDSRGVPVRDAVVTYRGTDPPSKPGGWSKPWQYAVTGDDGTVRRRYGRRRPAVEVRCRGYRTAATSKPFPVRVTLLREGVDLRISLPGLAASSPPGAVGWEISLGLATSDDSTSRPTCRPARDAAEARFPGVAAGRYRVLARPIFDDAARSGDDVVLGEVDVFAKVETQEATLQVDPTSFADRAPAPRPPRVR